MIVISNVEDMTFSEYIFEGLERYINIDEKDRLRLQRYLNRLHADAYTLRSFKEEFGLKDCDGIFTIYNMITDEDWVDDIIEFGNRCAANSVQVPTK
jgi:hypothetical protein